VRLRKSSRWTIYCSLLLPVLFPYLSLGVQSRSGHALLAPPCEHNRLRVALHPIEILGKPRSSLPAKFAETADAAFDVSIVGEQHRLKKIYRRLGFMARAFPSSPLARKSGAQVPKRGIIRGAMPELVGSAPNFPTVSGILEVSTFGAPAHPRCKNRERSKRFLITHDPQLT
jgi:hypothetical protein